MNNFGYAMAASGLAFSICGSIYSGIAIKTSIVNKKYEDIGMYSMLGCVNSLLALYLVQDVVR